VCDIRGLHVLHVCVFLGISVLLFSVFCYFLSFVFSCDLLFSVFCYLLSFGVFSVLLSSELYCLLCFFFSVFCCSLCLAVAPILAPHFPYVIQLFSIIATRRSAWSFTKVGMVEYLSIVQTEYWSGLYVQFGSRIGLKKELCCHEDPCGSGIRTRGLTQVNGSTINKRLMK
jgi:hypothetical protein